MIRTGEGGPLSGHRHPRSHETDQERDELRGDPSRKGVALVRRVWG